ncbi:hypothetical protein [Fulvivirga ligni]|uniref:hypothetical protein n=1 Tax=Fulvivirga ligni TaxID=2904246 RepID=UPI001F355AE9|nr:hypothetical protein [Fulvivirga ligni]UII21639.1 hypothetical protein LVD16_00100 [Fulvivirga ligni]
MRNDLYKDSGTQNGLIRDWTYSRIELHNNDHIGAQEFLYQMLARCLKATASTHIDDFLEFFHRLKSSNHDTILRLLTFSLNGNEDKFTNEIIELFNHFKHLGLLTYRDDLEYELRSLVEKSFPHMNAEQQNIILNTIRSYRDKKELRFWTTDEGKTILRFEWGLSKYYWLQRMPIDIIQSNPDLKMSLMELRRKFSKHKDIPKRRSVISGAVHSPIPSGAQNFMKKKHWLMSFRKYDTDEDRWGMDFLKGGRSELASEFGNIVKQYPSTEKLEIIKAVIESDNLPIEYAISGLYGWTQSGADLNLILPLFENVLEKDFSNQEVYITSLAGSLVNQDKTSLKVINYLVKTSLRFKK